VRSLAVQALEKIVRRNVIGFCYHTVSDRQLPHIESLYRCKSVAQFRRDLDFLRRSYRVVGYDDLERPRGASNGKPPVILTFDDGLVECHDVIRPLLLEYGLPAIFFVTTEFLDNRRLFYRQKVALCIEGFTRLGGGEALAARNEIARLFGAQVHSDEELIARLQAATWTEEPAIDAACGTLGIDPGAYLRTVCPYLTLAQVHTLAADGFTIGAHGTSHQQLGLMTEEEARAEIITACAAVSKLVPGTGSTTKVPFAFPFNGRGVKREMMRTIRDSNPQVGLFFDSTELALEPEFVINRLVVDDPGGATEHSSNLPARIRRAYAREIVRPLFPQHARSTS
jgi:peptidoglycan/xylan/chitin deacetylase (PgdA/CDA1 family)